MLQKSFRGLRRFDADEQGLETAEYVIIAGLLVLAIVAAIIGVRQSLIARYGGIKQAISATGPSAGPNLPNVPAGPQSK